MELWSLINTETKEYIRFNKIYVMDEVSIQHYFYDDPLYNKYYMIWVTDDYSGFVDIMKYVPEYASFSYKTPCTDKIDIANYEIIKLC